MTDLLRRRRMAQWQTSTTRTAAIHAQMTVAARRENPPPTTMLCETGATKSGKAPKITTIIAMLQIFENTLNAGILLLGICLEFGKIQSGQGTTAGCLPQCAAGVRLRYSISWRIPRYAKYLLSGIPSDCAALRASSSLISRTDVSRSWELRAESIRARSSEFSSPIAAATSCE